MNTSDNPSSWDTKKSVGTESLTSSTNQWIGVIMNDTSLEKYRWFPIPLECQLMTAEEKWEFLKVWGLCNPAMVDIRELAKNYTIPMIWEASFEWENAISCGWKSGFLLFRECIKRIPWYKDITEGEARQIWIYPNIVYRNYCAMEWFLSRKGFRSAKLDGSRESINPSQHSLTTTINCEASRILRGHQDTYTDALWALGIGMFWWRSPARWIFFSVGHAAMVSWNQDLNQSWAPSWVPLWCIAALHFAEWDTIWASQTHSSYNTVTAISLPKDT